MKLNNDNENKIVKEVINVIENGGVAILPTDTVYGIVADAFNEGAVKRIYDLKKRKMSNPCSVLVSNINMIEDITEVISKKEKEIIKKYFPRCLNNSIEKE